VGVATPTPAAARDGALFRRYRNVADPVDRETLVVRFLPLARQMAARYSGGNEPYEDLLQVASLALIRAIDRFDPDRCVAFSSYAIPTIVGEIKRHYRDKTWAVRVPRDLQELALAVDRAADRLATDLGRTPSVREIAAVVAESEEAVMEALTAMHAHHAASLDAARTDDSELAIRDTLKYHERGYDVAEERELIDHLVGTLSQRDREVLRLRFEEDLTQREIGERIGVSQMHVSRILRHALQAVSRAAGQLTDAQQPQRGCANAPAA
jgi:RNA polymerase sigma-B factor